MSSELFDCVKICIIFCAYISCLKAEPLSGKNVQRVAQHDLDFVASIAHHSGLAHRKDNHICSGTLISPLHVLTHERCILNKNQNNIAVYVGSPDVRSASHYHVCKWLSYSTWYSETSNSILEIPYSHIAVLALCMKVSPVISAPASFSPLIYDELEGSEVTVAGWGLLQDNSKSWYLKKASVKLLARNQCNRFSSGQSREQNQYFCTHSSPYTIVKPGDAGGPLLDKKKRIIGINSGTWYNEARDLNEAINFHVNVSYYRTFIKETTDIVF